LVFTYSLPGAGGSAISFSPMDVPVPTEFVTYGVKTDEEPFDVILEKGTTRGDVLLVTNNTSGSLSVIPADNLTPIDLNPNDSKIPGMTRISAANFRQVGQKPARGTSQMVPSPDGRLLFVTSTLFNNIYVINAHDQGIEAMIDLTTVAPAGGMRGMVIASD